MQNVRIGKHVPIELEASNRDEATAKVEDACKKLLAKLIKEGYSYTIHEA